MKPFRYERASAVASACAAAAQPAAKFIAGGTNLIDLMKLQIETPTHLVDIGMLPLADIEETAEGGLRIGALVTNSTSPQTIGLEWASPGIGLCHNTFAPVTGLQSSGRFCPSALPAASCPRNDGQCPLPRAGGGSALFAVPAFRTRRRASIAG